MRNLKRSFICITLSALVWADLCLLPGMAFAPGYVAFADEAEEDAWEESLEEETDVPAPELYEEGEMHDDGDLPEAIPEDAVLCEETAGTSLGTAADDRWVGDTGQDSDDLIEEMEPDPGEEEYDSETMPELAASWTQVWDIYERVGDQMARSAKTYQPKIGSMGGEWEILGLARGGWILGDGIIEAYLANVADTVASKQGVLHAKKYTEYSRVVLALTSLGADVTNVAGYNLLAPLADFNQTVWQGVNGAIFALIAFDSHAYEIPAAEAGKTQTTREGLISHILSKEIAGGGWAMSGNRADPDLTGMAVQALAPYYGQNAAVVAAIDRAVAVLSTIQDSDGGYTTFGTASSESCAQVVVALSALGIDANSDSRFVKNGRSVVDALLTYANSDGTFRHVMTGEADAMATEQGFYALVAYERFQNGMNSLYDMTDVEISSPGYSAVPSVPAAQFDGKTADLMPQTESGTGGSSSAGNGGASSSEGGTAAPSGNNNASGNSGSSNTGSSNTGSKGSSGNTGNTGSTGKTTSSGSGSKSGTTGHTGSSGTQTSSAGGTKTASDTTKSVTLTLSGSGTGASGSTGSGAGSTAGGTAAGGSKAAAASGTGSGGRSGASAERESGSETGSGDGAKDKNARSKVEKESETDESAQQGGMRREAGEDVAEQLTEDMSEGATDGLHRLTDSTSAGSAGRSDFRTGSVSGGILPGNGQGSGAGMLPIVPICVGTGASALLLLVVLLKRQLSLTEQEKETA